MEGSDTSSRFGRSLNGERAIKERERDREEEGEEEFSSKML